MAASRAEHSQCAELLLVYSFSRDPLPPVLHHCLCHVALGSHFTCPALNPPLLREGGTGLGTSSGNCSGVPSMSKRKKNLWWFEGKASPWVCIHVPVLSLKQTFQVVGKVPLSCSLPGAPRLGTIPLERSAGSGCPQSIKAGKALQDHPLAVQKKGTGDLQGVLFSSSFCPFIVFCPCKLGIVLQQKSPFCQSLT